MTTTIPALTTLNELTTRATSLAGEVRGVLYGWDEGVTFPQVKERRQALTACLTVLEADVAAFAATCPSMMPAAYAGIMSRTSPREDRPEQTLRGSILSRSRDRWAGEDDDDGDDDAISASEMAEMASVRKARAEGIAALAAWPVTGHLATVRRHALEAVGNTATGAAPWLSAEQRAALGGPCAPELIRRLVDDAGLGGVQEAVAAWSSGAARRALLAQVVDNLDGYGPEERAAQLVPPGTSIPQMRGDGGVIARLRAGDHEPASWWARLVVAHLDRNGGRADALRALTSANRCWPLAEAARKALLLPTGPRPV